MSSSLALCLIVFARRDKYVILLLGKYDFSTVRHEVTVHNAYTRCVSRLVSVLDGVKIKLMRTVTTGKVFSYKSLSLFIIIIVEKLLRIIADCYAVTKDDCMSSGFLYVRRITVAGLV